MSFLDQISAPPCPWTMYIGYFVIPEVKRTSVTEGNLINRYMMSVKKFRTNCRKSAFLLPVRTFALAVAMCNPPKKPKKPQKRLMDFHNGITCRRFDLEGWDLV